MLADRERATRVHEAARRRAIIDPIRRHFLAGFGLSRRDPAELDPLTAAFKEGAEAGMFDGGCPPDVAWDISETRKALLERLDAED